MDHDAGYTVTVQGKDFVLTRSQIEFGGRNYFSICFLGDFREAQTRRLQLSRDPHLFRIVLDYLCGYTVLPLSAKVIPPHMSPGLALINLRADAEFYQLDGLVTECDALLKPGHKSRPLLDRYMVLGCSFTYSNSDDIGTFSWYRKVISRRISANRTVFMMIDQAITRASDGSTRTWMTYVSETRLAEEPLVKMQTPATQQGFAGLRTIAGIERFASSNITNYDRMRWKLIGWHVKFGSGYRSDTELMVVLEDLEA